MNNDLLTWVVASYEIICDVFTFIVEQAMRISVPGESPYCNAILNLVKLLARIEDYLIYNEIIILYP